MNEEILKNLNIRLDAALDRGRKLVDDEELDLRIEEFKLRAELAIRKNPLKSVGAGLLVGFILGKILSSDDSDYALKGQRSTGTPPENDIG
ncbi:MAG: hypothetical protein U5K69_26130 [Balneolaceae bacterium]|nr:hypothetical protein [Balneolaceae bacterium]